MIKENRQIALKDVGLNLIKTKRIMKKLVFIALLSLIGMTNVFAQQETTTTAEKVFDVVDEMPSFPGGQGAMMEFLSKNIKYPIVAEENGIQGRVLVKIVVKKDGTIDSPTVVKGVDPSLNKEAIRVVKTMPKWIPGKQKGEPVNVSFTVPVTFRI